jgi:hypothetical protein
MTVRGANYPRKPNDDYPTPPEVLDVLFSHVNLGPTIFDPACGRLKRVMKAAECHGLHGTGSDIIYGHDFLSNVYHVAADIVTNPPFGDRRGTLTLKFIEHALMVTKETRQRIAMLLPVDFDSGKTRIHVFNHPAFALKLVLLDRIKWFNNKAGSLNHAWFVWDWHNDRPPIIRYARTSHGDHVKTKGGAYRTGRAAPAAGRRAHV